MTMNPHSHPATLQEQAGVLHFSVPVAGRRVDGVLSNDVWAARFGLGCSDASLRELYLANRRTIDEAVARKAGGRPSPAPVVLTPDDL